MASPIQAGKRTQGETDAAKERDSKTSFAKDVSIACARFVGSADTSIRSGAYSVATTVYDRDTAINGMIWMP